MSDAATVIEETNAPIVLYDGVCGFCNQSVQLILRNDRHGRFRFAALQSEVGQALLRRHGLPADDLDTFVLVEDGRAYLRSTGALRVARRMDGAWRLLSALSIVPRPLRDFAYDLFARNRYRMFGRLDACMLPPPEVRSRFLG
jgi:predicted DCC family thiol-disulfide oxidoreductase YuxK